MSWQSTYEYIITNITTNGVRAISGAKMQTALLYLLNLQRGETRADAAVVITANTSNIITFKNRANEDDPFPVLTVFAIPKPRVYDADGNNLDFTIFDVTVNGFKITPVENGFLDYVAMEMFQSIPD